jgi:large subunit ribosomal protein L10
MANLLNQKICEELGMLFQEADECVLVDFTGLTVDEVNSFRASLTENKIQMQVVKTSLTHLILKEQNRTGYEAMLEGPTAVVWGGDGIVHLSKSVNDFAKKSKKLKIKGGLLGKESIDQAAVKRLTTVPDKPVLLGSIVGAFMDPLQGFASGVGQLLSSIANVIDGLQEKRAAEEGKG